MKKVLKKINSHQRMVEKHFEKHFREISKKGMKFQEEVWKNAATAIIAGFSFIIGLAWRDAIQLGIDRILVYFKIGQSLLISKIITALIITIIGVFAIINLNKWVKTKTQK